MNKIRTIIVDDEPLALDLLRSFLRRHPEVEIVAECQNGKQAVASATEHQPDLMFLDIQMPGLTGFDVVKHLQADIMPLVVFATAYEQFALSAFDVHAVDYLLKPLEANSVDRAIKRCRERLTTQMPTDGFKPNMIGAIDAIAQQRAESGDHSEASSVAAHREASEADAPDQKIIIKDRSAITLIDQKDIDWVDAAGDYMCLHASGATHIMRSTMKSLLTQLNPDLFKRVHRSTIVNLNRIEKIIPHTKGEFFLELAENERIKVSRNYRSVIKEFLAATGAR